MSGVSFHTKVCAGYLRQIMFTLGKLCSKGKGSKKETLETYFQSQSRDFRSWCYIPRYPAATWSVTTLTKVSSKMLSTSWHTHRSIQQLLQMGKDSPRYPASWRKYWEEAVDRPYLVWPDNFYHHHHGDLHHVHDYLNHTFHRLWGRWWQNCHWPLACTASPEHLGWITWLLSKYLDYWQ